MIKKNERTFLFLIEKGIFKVFENGEIYKCRTRQGFPYKYRDCKPRLIGIKCSGYIQIRHRYKGKYIRVIAHRIIWVCFNGEIPLGKEINHKNGIKHDNRLENLEIVTRSENMIHAVNILKRELGLKGLKERIIILIN